MAYKVVKECGCVFLDVEKNTKISDIFGKQKVYAFIDRKDGHIRERGWITKDIRLVQLIENKTNCLYQIEPVKVKQ